LESEASAVQDLNCAKARELLGYLACHRERHLAREVVIGTLWGEMQRASPAGQTHYKFSKH
jgi:two-component SAPR family response regulator